MYVNALATETGFKVGPVVFETLIKHYFDRHKKTVDGKPVTPLRQDELMYDEVFNVVKVGRTTRRILPLLIESLQSFLRLASFHTVEDVQGFANTRIPSPPSFHVVRLLVPMSSCDEAAKVLVTAFGGEEVAKRVVGGVKWWQVRGISGVDAQWITAKKDWESAKRRQKMNEKAKETEQPDKDPEELQGEKSADNGCYEKHMDEMRCILYCHGGGYYFGSVDQERIQRHARKINGRVFDLFLIRPPPGAAHCPVNPAHIVIAGDSAGGGLSLALLQVIRDSDLPMPAGGVLISPCIHTNTATDVVPEWGLSLQKPSVLWPPPPDEVSTRVHASLRLRIREVFNRADEPIDPTVTMRSMAQSTKTGSHVDVGTTTSLPTSDSQHLDQTVSLVARSGETLSTSNQLHMYTQNNLIPHPLVSPVMSYLGGLPPLLFIASDKEVLRDEIIYTAHKAANPDKYPIKEDTRTFYPALNGIETRHKPTQVHLQVYDDAAHVLPVLFPFTTPAKYCFRAIATFCKHVTGLSPMSNPRASFSCPDLAEQSPWSQHSKIKRKDLDIEGTSTPGTINRESPRKSLKRSLSSSLSRAMRSRPLFPRAFSLDPSFTSDVVASDPKASDPTDDVLLSPASSGSATPLEAERPSLLTAGDPYVYRATGTPWDGTMIRERVSTQGIIRPLESESELGAMAIDPDIIGRLSELTLRRYLDACAIFDKKFAHTIRTIEKDRQRNLKLAKKDTTRNMAVLHQSLARDDVDRRSSKSTPFGIKEGLLAATGSWSWAWVLDGEERPPPSSIVSRRDTAEARRLAKVADQSVRQDDQALSGNRFWSAVISFLTAVPDSPSHVTKRPSRLSRFLRRERRGAATEGTG
ncbi:hypothetical protein H0H92_012445 [Tricholoma furcatifolium]|nr:hypothetical protein H0H92_012445 [Tricholoma furcatifolium]